MTELEKNIRAKILENDIESILVFLKKVDLVDRRTLLRIFKTEDCKVSVLKRMCKVLKCSSKDLLGF